MMIAEESTSLAGVTAPTSQRRPRLRAQVEHGLDERLARYIASDPLWRSHHQNELTFSFVYAFSENFLLPISHDEVVHGKGACCRKMPGDPWQQLANVRAYLGFMWAHPGKQLLFMGQEFGQRSEWSEEREPRLVDPRPAGAPQLLGFVGALNRVYRENPPLWERDHDASSFTRIGAPDWDPNIVAFVRRDAHGGHLAVISNFSGSTRHGVRLDLPLAGGWTEVLNTDAAEFGGYGQGNLGLVYARDVENGSPQATLTMPALSTIWLRHQTRSARPDRQQGLSRRSTARLFLPNVPLRGP